MVLAEALELGMVSLYPVVVSDKRLAVVDSRVIFDVVVIEKVLPRGEHLRRDDRVAEPGVLLVHKRRPEGFLEEEEAEAEAGNIKSRGRAAEENKGVSKKSGKKQQWSKQKMYQEEVGLSGRVKNKFWP